MTPIPTVIDLYHGDTVTSFEDLKKAGIERVIHKATEGVTEVDPAYASRMPEALAAGLQWEAYHFWRPDDADAQATNFLNVTHDVRLPKPSAWWLDYEESGGKPNTIAVLMRTVNAVTGGTMGLYGPRTLLEELIDASNTAQKAFFAQCPLWIAEPGVKKLIWPKQIWPKPPLWQYTFHGTIAGVKNRCDLNCIPE